VKNFKNGTLYLIIFLTSVDAFAGAGSRLLSTALREEEVSWTMERLSNLSSRGLRSYEEFYAYAKANPLRAGFKKIVAQGANHDLQVIELETVNGKSIGKLQQSEIQSNNLVRTAVRIPETTLVPDEVTIEKAYRIGIDTALEPKTVKRTFKKGSPEQFEIEYDVAVAQIPGDSSGNNYGIVARSRVLSHNNDVTAKAYLPLLENGSVLEMRKIEVNYQDFSAKPWIQQRGQFVLPAEIKGNVIEVEIDSSASRLKFKTTEGIEYEYAIERNPENPEELSFRQVGFSRLADGARSLLAEVKINSGRQSATGAVRGMEVVTDVSK
jgi:hypothetical protein